MYVSKYLFKYICELYPQFNEKLKITSNGLISQKYLNEIEKDEKLKNIWLDILENKPKLLEDAKKKYQVYRDIKEYNRKYCLDYYYKHHEECKKRKRELRRAKKELEIKLRNDSNEKKSNESESSNDNYIDNFNNKINFIEVI